MFELPHLLLADPAYQRPKVGRVCLDATLLVERLAALRRNRRFCQPTPHKSGPCLRLEYLVDTSSSTNQQG